ARVKSDEPGQGTGLAQCCRSLVLLDQQEQGTPLAPHMQQQLLVVGLHQLVELAQAVDALAIYRSDDISGAQARASSRRTGTDGHYSDSFPLARQLVVCRYLAELGTGQSFVDITTGRVFSSFCGTAQGDGDGHLLAIAEQGDFDFGTGCTQADGTRQV